MWKLDGHTRSYLWHKDEIPQPEALHVNVFRVRNEQEAERLYSHFDSIIAVENGRDATFGACRSLGLHFESGFMQSMKFGGAVRQAYRYVDGTTWAREPESRYRAVEYFADELMLIDQCSPFAARWPQNITCGAILSFARRGDAVLPFWQAYTAGMGMKRGKEKDGVEALEQYRLLAASGYGQYHGNQRDLVFRCCRASEAWLRDQTFINRLNIMPPIQVEAHLRAIRKRKPL